MGVYIWQKYGSFLFRYTENYQHYEEMHVLKKINLKKIRKFYSVWGVKICNITASVIFLMDNNWKQDISIRSPYNQLNNLTTKPPYK